MAYPKKHTSIPLAGGVRAADRALLRSFAPRDFNKIVAATQAAANEALITDAAVRLVHEQVVFRLVASGWTTREIADATGISKSEVARLRLAVTSVDGLEEGHLAEPAELLKAISVRVRELWAQ